MNKFEAQAKAASAMLRETRKDRKRVLRRSPFERNLIVIWGLSRGWANFEIGRWAGCSVATIKITRKRFAQRPWTVFDYPVLSKSGGRLWKCELCLVSIPGTETKARRHVLVHLGFSMAGSIMGIYKPEGEELR